MLAVARPPSAEMLEADPVLRRLETWGRVLKLPVIASLALFATGIVLTIVFSLSWLFLVAAAALAWLLFARLAIKVWRDIHLSDFEWRLEHASPRERTLLRLAQRATWQWTDEVPDDATHAVLVIGEIGGQLQVEAFCDLGRASERLAKRVDLLAGERNPVVVGLVELDADPGEALIEVEAGRLGGRRPLDSLPLAEDGWLVGI